MNELQRLTTEYIEIEDRVRIIGELESQNTVVMWLSQRLLVRLLPHFFLWQEKQSCNSSQSQINQYFAQNLAKAYLKPERPVKRFADTQEWLVCSIDLTTNAEIFEINFRSATGQRVTLALQALSAKLWLEIIYSLWLIAEWPNGIWPEWYSSSISSANFANPSRFH